MQATNYYGIVPERSEDGKFYTDFQIVRRYISSEANASESVTLICIHSFIKELFVSFIHNCLYTYIRSYIRSVNADRTGGKAADISHIR